VRRLAQLGIAVAAAAILIAVAGSFWRSGGGPTGFRDVRWGTTEAALRARIPIAYCFPVDTGVDFGTRRCRADRGVKIGEVLPNGLWFFLRDDAFVAWRLDVSMDDGTTMRKALGERYGTPSETSRDRMVWRGRAGSVMVGRNGYQDIVIGLSATEMNRIAAPAKDAASQAAKGL